MPSAAMLHDYRADRDLQNARYEAATGLPVGEQWRQEYRDYFGVGDCHGTGVEKRITLRDYMQRHARQREPEDLEPIEPATSEGEIMHAVPDAAPDRLASAYVRALETGDGNAARLLGAALDDLLDMRSLAGHELAALALLEYAPAAAEITRRAVKRAQRRAHRSGVAA